MAAPILATKLYIPPPRSRIVLRPRLLGQMNDALSRKLTLISAPAGFGKSTLVSEWVASCAGWPIAWLSLDEGDNDLTRFLTYLITAMQTLALKQADGSAVKPGERALSLLHASEPQPPPAETILTALLNESATVADDFVLVLDDYHALDARPVDDAIDFLLEHVPPQMHLIIATREDPHLSLARLRARGQMTELRAADLRFTAAEAAEFLNQVMGLDLSAADIAALEARTEGWIAGLQLAALSMQGNVDAASFIRSFTGSHHFVLDYLIEEVLQRQSERVQTFLLCTSILDRMCGPLCDAVLLDAAQSVSGQETLEHLERANLFIVPLDNERRWYRYHHLFGDLLRQRLGQPHELSEYHLRASAWYADNNDPAQAFHHALAAGDHERAAGLVEAAWEGMDRSFQSAIWLGWVNKLPDAVVRSRPRLCLQLGSAFMDAGDPQMSETHLQNAERALNGEMDDAEAKSLAGNIAMIRASNAQNQGNLAETVKYAELSLQLIPEDDVFLRASATITLEFIHWTNGDLEASLRAMHAWIDDMQRLGNRVFAIASAFAVADMQVALGHLHEAEMTLRQAIQQAAAQGQEGESFTAHHHLGLALLAHERGDEAAARQYLQTAADLGQRTTLVDWPYRWNMAQARFKESAGEWDAALELLDAAKRVYVKNPVPMLQPVEAHKARIHLGQGRLDKAQAWARQARERGISTEADVHYMDEYDHLTLVRVRLAEGSFAGVTGLLECLLVLAETQKRTASVIEILLTQALAHQAQGNQSQALAALEHALALAELEGWVRIFADEGEAMRPLLLDLRSSKEKRSERPLTSYVDKILAAFPQPEEPGSKSTAKKHGSELIEPLTDRELEILCLIAEGQSNAEIGQRLYLALSTVKGHNLRIFNKLQVQNRTEAVARARELSLL